MSDHGKTDANSRSAREPPCCVRTSLSSHLLHPDVSTVQDRTLFAGSPPPPRPCSSFSVKTHVIKGKCSFIRKVLDVGGCTKGDTFDIHHFSRVQPPMMNVRPLTSQRVAVPGCPAPMEEMQPRPLRDERWRGNVRQMLYASTDTTTSCPDSPEAVRPRACYAI
jgi:hypothetical protein